MSKNSNLRFFGGAAVGLLVIVAAAFAAPANATDPDVQTQVNVIYSSEATITDHPTVTDALCVVNVERELAFCAPVINSRLTRVKPK